MRPASKEMEVDHFFADLLICRPEEDSRGRRKARPPMENSG